MTTATAVEVEAYYERVRAALGFLAPDVRDELLEELPGHLAEVSAEGDGSMVERLGEPEAYAEELRIAAGLDEAPVAATAALSSERVADLARRTVELARRFDVQAGKLTGYPRLSDLIKAAQPGWWVVRGWLVAQVLVRGRDEYTLRAMLIPRIGGSLLIGAVFTAALVVGSIWLGRRSLGFRVWPRRVIGTISVLIALWAGAVLANHVGLVNYVYTNSGSYASPYDNVNDVYVYDQDGKLVPGARLFDQNGNPIQLGSLQCDSTINDGTTPLRYPLCPNNAGPFRAGPGALASAGPDGKATSPAPSDSSAGGSTTPSAASSAPGAGPSAAPTSTPKPSATAKTTAKAKRTAKATPTG